MRFAFIHSEREDYPITVLCRVMQVARSGYHAWVVREECERMRQDRVLAVHVAAAFERSRRTYGSPRIQTELREEGVRIGRARIARIMRERRLVARRRKARRKVPASCPCDQVAPSRLARDFRARGPNRKWVTDVKYVRTSAGWLYLAPVIDHFSRRVVGCAMSTEQDGALSLAALTSAIEARGEPRRVLVHSDRGGIYIDEEYVRKAKALGMRRSMSRACNPWDNAVIESFFRTLRFELLDRGKYSDPEHAQRSIAEWIDGFYNIQRRHTTIGNMSPIKYELTWQMRQQRT
jgi:transposase InsO family protein